MFDGVLKHLDDVFELPVHRSPGAFFLGAMFRPEKIGLPGHGAGPIGVGGRGWTREHALASCLGEAAELISYLERPSDPLLKAFNPSRLPDQKTLDWALSGAGFSQNTIFAEMDWIAAHTLNGSDDVLFPFELVIRRSKGRTMGSRMAESNGMGAHSTHQGAISSGLMEVIERDAIALWWHGGRPSRLVEDVELEAIGLSAVAKEVRNTRDREWWLLDITTDLGIPVAVCMSAEPSGDAVIAGFGAALNFAAAAHSAFLEMCQMEFAQEHAVERSKQQAFDDLKSIDLAWLDRHQNLSVTTYPRLGGLDPDPQERPNLQLNSTAEVVLHLADKGYSVFWCNLSRDEIGMPVTRILVPGLQSAKAGWQTARLRSEAIRNNTDLDISAKQTSPI